MDSKITQFINDDFFKQLGRDRQIFRLKDGDIRNVSILYADLTGFTTICQNLDQEESQVLLDRLLAMFTLSVEKYGGEVSRYAGDQIMALFGAKKTLEKSLERCVRSGISILNDIEEFNKLSEKYGLPEKLKYPFKVRVGINYGTVATGKVGADRSEAFTVYGDTVNMAARMESNAPVGKIMLPYDTSKLVDDVFEFEEVGEKELKGFAQQVRCVVFKSIKSELSKKIRHQEIENYIGRKSELNLLLKIFEASKSVPCRVSVTGEGGIGKSRLIREFLFSTLGKREGISNLSLKGNCSSLNFSSYSCFLGLVKRFVRYSGAKDLSSLEGYLAKNQCPENYSEALEDEKQLLQFLFNHIQGKKQSSDNFDFIIKKSLITFFRACAIRAEERGLPLVVVLEDIHAADSATISFIQDEFSKTKISNMMLIISGRKLPQELSDGFINQISLQPLSESDLESIINQTERDKFKKLLDQTGGVPLFMEELYFSSGLSSKNNPCQIFNRNEILLGRLDQLDSKQKQVMQAASIISQKFTRDLFFNVLKKMNILMTEDEINQYLSGFLRVDEPHFYSIRHDLIREAIYNSMLSQNKKVIHHHVAMSLEESIKKYPDEVTAHKLSFAARNFFAADELQKSAIFFLDAIQLSRKNFDQHTTISLLHFVLENSLDRCLTNNDDQFILNCIYAETMVFLGRPRGVIEKQFIKTIEFAESYGLNNVSRAYFHFAKFLHQSGRLNRSKEFFQKALELTQELNDSERQGTIYLGLGRLYSDMGMIGEALSNFELCIEVNSPNDCFSAPYAKLEIAKCMVYENNYEQAIKLINDVSSQEILKNDLIFQLYKNSVLCFCYNYQTLTDKIKEPAEENLQIAQKIGRVDFICQSLSWLCVNLLEKETEQAIAYANEAIKIAEDSGMEWELARAYRWRGKAFAACKRYAQAHADFIKSIDLYEGLQGYTYLCVIYWDLGNYYQYVSFDRKSMDKIYEKYLEVAFLTDRKRLQMFALHKRGKILMSDRNYAEALPLFQQSLEMNANIVHPDYYQAALVCASQCLIEQNKYAEASMLMKQGHIVADNSKDIRYKTLQKFTVLQAETCYRKTPNGNNAFENNVFKFIQNLKEAEKGSLYVFELLLMALSLHSHFNDHSAQYTLANKILELFPEEQSFKDGIWANHETENKRYIRSLIKSIGNQRLLKVA